MARFSGSYIHLKVVSIRADILWFFLHDDKGLVNFFILKLVFFMKNACTLWNCMVKLDKWLLWAFKSAHIVLLKIYRCVPFQWVKKASSYLLRIELMLLDGLTTDNSNQIDKQPESWAYLSAQCFRVVFLLLNS